MVSVCSLVAACGMHRHAHSKCGTPGRAMQQTGKGAAGSHKLQLASAEPVDDCTLSVCTAVLAAKEPVTANPELDTAAYVLLPICNTMPVACAWTICAQERLSRIVCPGTTGVAWLACVLWLQHVACTVMRIQSAAPQAERCSRQGRVLQDLTNSNLPARSRCTYI